MSNWYIKVNMVSERGVRSWFATVSPVWLKIVCTCWAMLIAHTWGGVLEYESGVMSHIDKIQGFECVYKACELLLLSPINFGCTCWALLIAHTWGGVLEHESGVVSHIEKIKGLSVYIKLVSYSSYYQLVLGWNLIWAYMHDSFV